MSTSAPPVHVAETTTSPPDAFSALAASSFVIAAWTVERCAAARREVGAADDDVGVERVADRPLLKDLAELVELAGEGEHPRELLVLRALVGGRRHRGARLRDLVGGDRRDVGGDARAADEDL